MVRRVSANRNSAIYRSLTVSTKDSSAQSSSSLSLGATSPTTGTPKVEPIAGIETKKKTQAELDEELRLKLEEMSGDGGAAGLEYENGKPVALKRGVKDNMFRVI